MTKRLSELFYESRWLKEDVRFSFGVVFAKKNVAIRVLRLENVGYILVTILTAFSVNINVEMAG